MRNVILHGDVYACLNSLKDDSISVAITSPPYWQQRNYGFEDQIGQEDTPEDFIGRLLTIFNKLREKLQDDGIFFLNIGDKYQNRYGKSHLLLIPYRLAFHMVKNGWILEDIIIWYKPNHMPSSVKDRFTNTHEPIFVFAKNKNNIYLKNRKNLLKINLQQIKWKHTASFPEKLIDELLKRVKLKNTDIILDPFAGTGTVGLVVKKMRQQLFSSKINSVLIDNGTEYIEIMKERVGIKFVKNIENLEYKWASVKEIDLEKLKSLIPLKDKHGEISIFETNPLFLRALSSITNDEFKDFYRADALFFYGVKNWTLEDFYYTSRIYDLGYIVRNIIIISNNDSWFPIFMFANDNTRIAYKFHLDRVRTNIKTEEHNNWSDFKFIGRLVRDITGKKTKEGKINKIIKNYDDGFPKFVEVIWDESISKEYILHSENDELIQEGLNFRCPDCNEILIEPFDLVSENICYSCNTVLWEDLETIPIIEEPHLVINNFNELKNSNTSYEKKISLELIEEHEKNTNSKFKGMDRVNWGQSPGARKIMIGEYFTKMRLYRLEHPLVAKYLKILRDSNGMGTKNVTESFPKNYEHTVGHWFRTDFGGSIPIPKDIDRLQEIFRIKDGLLCALKKTALKLQIVKASIKGRNPGDYLEGLTEDEIKVYFKKLYLPSQEYIKLMNKLSKM